MPLPRGKLIVFEGADDLGKTTQIEKVYDYLLDKNEKVVKTREPGGTKIGDRIRDILLNTDEKLPPKTQLLLFEADRSYHYESKLKPLLEQGYTILCDRFYLSTLVYQHKLNGTKFHDVDYLNTFATDDLEPDKVFVFHGKRLTENIKDAYEKNLGNNTHEMLNNYYYEYGELFKGNHILIEANREKEVIFNEIISYIEE